MPLTLKQHAYAVIRKRLLAGEIRPGGRLSDDAFARELGISRSPVREAISQLASEGLVEHRPRSGAYVRIPDRHELQELYEVRLALETFAAARAAERIVGRDLQKLEKICKQTRDVVCACRDLPGRVADRALTDRFLSLDYDFHMHVLEAAGNERVMKMVSECKILTRVFGHVPVAHDLRLLARTYLQHVRVLRAIRRRDADVAARWMRDHIVFAQGAVLEAYADPQEQTV